MASARVHASARDRLRLGSLGAAGASALYTFALCFNYPEVAGPASVSAAGFIALAASLYLLARRATISDRWITAAGAVLLLAMGGGLLHGFLLLATPSLTVFMALVVLAAGALQSHTGWLLTVVTLSVASWLSAGFAMLGAAFALPAAALVCVAVISVLTHLVIMRYLSALDAMRARDRQHHEELAAALAAARHELGERQRAEAEREHLREQLLHAQKLEAVGRLAGGVAHDMNNVLAAIIGVAEFIRSEPEAAVGENIDQIIEAARRGGELTRNLLGFSRRGKYRKERVDLSAVVAGVARLLSHTLPKSVQLTTEVSAGYAVEGDSGQLSQALMNLCLNASDAMNGTGPLHICIGTVALAGNPARALGLADGTYVALAVTDTGCGMDRETQSRMFEPFFTTKEQGRGTGLGLSMVYGTMVNHGGAIAVDSEPGRGTTITLHLPSVGTATRAPHTPPPPTTATDEPPPPGLVLVVDDEEMLRRVTRRILERAGYRVLTAGDGEEAAALFSERRSDISAVVLDMAMPGMGGAACFAALRALDPSARVILASGFALEIDSRACLAAGALAFLEKPFSSADLLAAVALAHRDRPATAAQPAPATAVAAPPVRSARITAL